MKRKFLEDMGLSKEQVDQIMDENGKDINNAKGDYDNVKEQLKTAQSDISERDKQIENLKNSVGDNEDLKNQIEKLQNENKEAKERHESEMKELKLSTAIKSALGDSVHDSDMVFALFDRKKLILNDDGKVTGLEEQLKSIKESKPFLFKEEKQEDEKPGFKPIGVPSGNHSNNQRENGIVDMKSAIEAKLSSQFNN
ncbi:MAG: phage scaffolding protein [Lachnospiraceae bacterium]